ncbi:ABC transporter permease [Methylosinus sp. H3A]|nr:ABC transporter permease [Methylosinus sp. H3A]
MVFSLTAVRKAGLAARSEAYSSNASLWAFVKEFFQRSLAIVLFLSIWELAPRLGVINRDFLPPLSEVLWQGYLFAADGKLLPHITVSLGRAVGGFALGVVIAVPLGVLLGWYSGFERYVNPLLQFLRQFNSISLLPVFILFFGVGYLTKVVIIFWVAAWPILLSTASGVKYVDPILVKYGRSLALSDWQIFVRIVAPSAIPSIIAGMRLAATYSFLVLVASEQVGASSGLGYLVENAQYILGIHMLYVAVLTLVAFGFLANQSLVLLERRLTRWKSESSGRPV